MPAEPSDRSVRGRASTGGARPRRRRGAWVRILLPAAIILVWLGGAALGGPLFGRIDEVSSNDRTAYLPTSAEATVVQERAEGFRESEDIPAIAVFVSESSLTDAQQDAISRLAQERTGIEGVGEVSVPLPSEDGRAVQVFVAIQGDADIGDAVAELRDDWQQAAPEGVEVLITGPAGFSADLVAGFAGIDGLLLGVALLAVLVILILVYRSALLPLVVLSTSLFALCVALLTVWSLANAGVLLLSGQTQGILFILVIGAATDYALLFVARFREELRTVSDTGAAVAAAWKGTLEPIAASGGTVIAGLLCLLLSDLRSNSTLGPVAAIGIVFAMLAALTLLPALLLLLGRAAFWPRRPVFTPDAPAGRMPGGRVWAALARLIRRRARPIWIGTTLVLIAGAVGVMQLNASGVAQSDLVLGASEAREGQEALGAHFPGGSGSPALVLVSQEKLQSIADELRAHPGVSSVSVLSADSESGAAPVTEDGISAYGPPGSPAPEPTVIDGDVLLQATLADAADSPAAISTVRELRAQLHTQDALIGGVTATAIDTDDASVHDRNLIIPVVLGVITLILMLLLRAIVAPLLLVATTVMSFGTAMGVSAWIFNGVLAFPGADPAVPLFGFVFLVALGIDYNIFLMTRVREEAIAHGTRTGVLRGLRITGGVITSAGLVLAATFAALAVIPILFLVQLAVIVAFGVLLDTFVVRTLLVPALVHDIGAKVWWPSALSRR